MKRINPDYTQAEYRKVKTLWRKHRNIWEISQITGIPESTVAKIVSDIN